MSTGSVIQNKTRIRWTQDLHEKFVECVNHLGGAESECHSITSLVTDFVNMSRILERSIRFMNIKRFFLDRGNSEGYSEAHGHRWLDHIPHKEPFAGPRLFEEMTRFTCHLEVGF